MKIKEKTVEVVELDFSYKKELVIEKIKDSYTCEIGDCREERIFSVYRSFPDCLNANCFIYATCENHKNRLGDLK